MSDKHKYYAILPAAGRSLRMGQPKLLLPWPVSDADDKQPAVKTIIDQVLRVWTLSRVDEVVVIIRKDDQALFEASARWQVSIVQPEIDPIDMKESVQHGLRYLQQKSPVVQDRCFVAPADLPTLSVNVINRLIDTEAETTTIVVPSFGGRSGHPALLPWSLTSEIFTLDEADGVDRVVKRHPKMLVEFPEQEMVSGINTPSEYQAALDKAIRRNDGQ